MNTELLYHYIEGLNAPQRAAVIAPEGPMLVIAGAGSGKTRVLTMRIAYLIAQGVRPYNILALTFTNKAAKEMKERIAQMVGAEARQLWMGTFHSVFARILRAEASTLGLSPDFTIYDAADSKSLIKNILKGMNLDEKNGYKASTVLGAISAAKNDLIMPQDYAQDEELMRRDKAAGRPKVAHIYALYMEECHKANALDFDDLLLYTNILFRDFKSVLEKYQERFLHILVDEYQDTNLSQYVIIKRLAEANENICVVGDDAQSIYSFRGARIENILNFQRDYGHCKVFKLEQNYRSTQNIVGAANRLIAHNVSQIPKDVFSEGEEGDKIRVWGCASDTTEAAKVVGDIVLRIRLEHKRPSDFAILYRTNSQSRVLEEELRKAGVPYKIYGGLAFYQRKEIKDALAYLRLTVNHNDVESLRRVINYPKRQIGDSTVDKMEQAARESGETLWNTMSTPRLLAKAGLRDSVVAKVMRFVGLIDALSLQAQSLNAYQLAVEMLSQSGILQELNAAKSEPDGKERFDNVQELLNGIKDFTESQMELGEPTDVSLYLQQVSLVTDLDDTEEAERVTLMTIHSSKGLEFDSVYIVGVEDNLFPSQRVSLDREGLEEERRLMYVALTRAKKTATVSYARRRFLNGKTTPSRPSCFVKELDPRFCDKPEEEERPSDGFGGFSQWGGDATFGSRPRFGGRPSPWQEDGPARVIREPRPGFRKVERRMPQSDFRPAEALTQTPDGKYTIGARVSHERFGPGTVKEIIGSNPADMKLRIAFDTQGEKTLLLKFARIHVIQ